MSSGPDRTLSVAVIGCGAFGRNHARVYHELAKAGERVKIAGVVDVDRSRADSLAREFGCQAYSSTEELLSSGGVDAASIAVPTLDHAAVARQLMRAGVDVLIEKPLTSTLAEADELIDLAEREKRIAQVGHLERFNPAVQATLPLITKPMFFEVHRLSVFTPRSLDVDVVLDLMIHDLDAVLAFVKSPIKEIRAAGLPILSNKVDIANARVEFESGCIANFTASRVSTERVRKLRFFQPRQYISIDYGRQDVLVFSVGDGAGAPSPNPNIKISKPAIVPEEPLRAEIRAFLDAVRTRRDPPVGLKEGRRALAVALEILDQIAAHADKFGLPASG
ncbi:MAG TPA: Gfo/Idh/MocA family oxidoreductase [Terriglobales bacterium]|nr:Gfo/Idh/MocA family oxidoreductase [Terriglobales bacterium]